MSVSFANKVIAGLRSHGVKVHLLAGWERRGNGLTSDYEGGIMHHTASSYANALPGTGITSLLRDGRSDLSGPLCNSAGNEDGSVTIVAAHPANHAGASGGRSMGPLPVTSSFNKRVWGHEIVYPGNSPMRDAQYRTMIILGRVLTDILGRPNAEWIRGHMETSITGKWDPGFAPGRTIDLAVMRRNINNFKGGDELADPRVVGLIEDLHMALISGVYDGVRKKDAKINKDLGYVMNNVVQALTAQQKIVEELHQVVVSGTFERFHDGDHAKLNDDLGYVMNNVNSSLNKLSEKVNQLSTPEVDVDEVAIATAVANAIGDELGLTEAQVETAVLNALRTQFNK